MGFMLFTLMCGLSVIDQAAPAKETPGQARLNEAKLEKARELKRASVRLRGEGKYSEAGMLAERACSILGAVYGTSSLEFAKCINDLAVICCKSGLYEEAQLLLKQTLTIFQDLGDVDRLDIATSLNNLAGVYYEQARYEKAELLLIQVLAIRKEVLGTHDLDVSISLNNLASLYEVQGKYGKAKLIFEQVLAINKEILGASHPSVAISLSNLAMLYYIQGDYGRAESIFEQALNIREKTLGTTHPDVASVLNNLAMVHKEGRGGYEKAERLYERALEIREKTLGVTHPDVAISLDNLAGLYYEQGEYEKAKSFFERALVIRKEALGVRHPYTAVSLHNLAGLYRKNREYGKAEQLYERALEITEEALGANHSDVARGLNSLAGLYVEKGEYGKAGRLHERALDIRERALGANHPDVAQSLNNLGLIYYEKREFAKAERLYERGLAIREKVFGADHRVVATSLSNLAVLYDHLGEYDLALKLRQRAFSIEEWNLVRTLTVAEESRRLAYAATLAGSLHYVLSLHLRVTPQHSGIAKLALTTLLRRKNRVQDLVSQSNAALRRSLPEGDRYLLDDLSDVDSQISLLSGHGRGKRSDEKHMEKLGKLQQHRARIWSELARHSSLIEALSKPVVIEDVQRALSVKSALVEFVQYIPRYDNAGVILRAHENNPSPNYAAYLIFSDRFDWVELGPAAPIDGHISAFRRALQTKQSIPTDLYDAVMRPIVDKLGSAHHLVIAPAGALSLVPFGALHDGERYLVQKYDLRYVTTGRDLLGPRTSDPVTTTPVTVVANPTGALLTDAEIEADFLQDFFPTTRILRGDDATETNVRTIERPIILHMATHGFIGKARNERDNPMFRSGLHLADIEQVEVDREQDDGQLTAYEVSGMDLRGTQLVVLSACETGMGAVDMSEGVFGLRRAFATAGARTTLMSLWEVSGATAQTMMEAYYRKLAEGVSSGEAMQAVQLEMLQTSEHAHPKDWAAFIVSGDDRPIELPPDQQPQIQALPVEPPVLSVVNPTRRGCAINTATPGDDLPAGMFFLGLIGLTVTRRGRS